MIAAGFDQRTARDLARRVPLEQVRRQYEWLSLRNPVRNPMGMLRRAIEENWPPPVGGGGAADSAGNSASREFVAHYYAGWARNPGAPVTTPSDSEVKVAHPYVVRLQQLPSPPSTAGLGRRFAEYARRESEGNPHATNSFPVVLKLYGEEFFLKVEREGIRSSKERILVARQSHEKTHRATYLVWLGERIAELEKAHPEVSTAFRTAEQEKLATYRRNFPVDSKLLATALADFERTETRAVRLREFFQKQYPELQLPDFWAWDAQHNPDRFPATTDPQFVESLR